MGKVAARDRSVLVVCDSLLNHYHQQPASHLPAPCCGGGGCGRLALTLAVSTPCSPLAPVSSTYTSTFAAAASTDGTTHLGSGKPVPLARPPSSGGRWWKWVPGCTLLVEVTTSLGLGPSPKAHTQAKVPPASLFPQWPTHSQECRDADHDTSHSWSASLHSHLPTPRKSFLVNLRHYIFY